jgi:hypothetical protein
LALSLVPWGHIPALSLFDRDSCLAWPKPIPGELFGESRMGGRAPCLQMPLRHHYSAPEMMKVVFVIGVSRPATGLMRWHRVSRWRTPNGFF